MVRMVPPGDSSQTSMADSYMGHNPDDSSPPDGGNWGQSQVSTGS